MFAHEPDSFFVCVAHMVGKRASYISGVAYNIDGTFNPGRRKQRNADLVFVTDPPLAVHMVRLDHCRSTIGRTAQEEQGRTAQLHLLPDRQRFERQGTDGLERYYARVAVLYQFTVVVRPQ